MENRTLSDYILETAVQMGLHIGFQWGRGLLVIDLWLKLEI